MSADLTTRGTPRKRLVARPGTPVAERLALHTDRSGDCWLWTGAVDKVSGYGRFNVDGKTGYAHRAAYEVHVGPIPVGKEVDHLCRVRRCCNPSHLEAVTPQVNTLRGFAPGAIARRRSVCIHGVHAYEDSAYFYKGRRACRQCRIDYCRLWRESGPDVREARKLLGLPVVDLASFYARRQDVAA